MNRNCPLCNFENNETAKFCSECGAGLREMFPAAEPIQTAVTPNTESSPYKAGSLYEKYFATNPEVVLAVVAGGAIIFAALMISFLISRGSSQPSTTTPPSPHPSSSTISSIPNVIPKPAQPVPAASSSAADLQRAKDIITDIMLEDDLNEAVSIMSNIPESHSEYSEAQKLLKQIKAGKIKALPSIPNYSSNSLNIYYAFRNVDNKISYEQLKKNADRFRGYTWGFNGRVLEIYESGGTTVARVGVGAWNMNAVFVEGNFTTEFVEGDRVYVIGQVAGTKTYESQAGWTISIPKIDADALLKPAEASQIRAALKRLPTDTR